MEKQFPYRVFSKPKYKLKFILLTSMCLAVFGLEESYAQVTVVDSVSGPTFTDITNPSFSDADKFKIDSSTECPVPSFNLASFYGKATENANPIIIPLSENDFARGRSDNFGVSAGITVPLAGRYGKACKDLIESKAKSLQIFNTSSELFLQSQVLRECHLLYTLNVNFEAPVFDKDGSASALFPCRGLSQSFSTKSPFTKKEVSKELSGSGGTSKITAPEKEKSVLLENAPFRIDINDIIRN